MKSKHLYIILVCFYSLSTKAQNLIPNLDFENWDSITGTRPFHEPVGWLSYNRFYQDTNRIYSFQSTDSHSGNYSLLVTPAVDTQMAMYFTNSRVMIKGKNDLAEFNIPNSFNGYGYLHVGKKPIRVSGWYKYVKDSSSIWPQLSFPGFIAVAAFAGDNGDFGTGCGLARKLNFIPVDTFTKFSIPFEYECPPGSIIDSITIYVSFNSKNKSMNPTGKFWLDDLEIEYEEVTSVAPRIENEFEILPNPGTDKLYFSREIDPSQPIHVVDAQGKSINCPPLGNQCLDTGTLPKGLYLIRVFQKARKESGPGRWVERRWVKM